MECVLTEEEKAVIIREEIQKTKRYMRSSLALVIIGVIICTITIVCFPFGLNIMGFLFGLYVTLTSIIVFFANKKENKKLLNRLERLQGR